MHTLIIYDSWYGNTEQIAKIIASETGLQHTRLVNLRKTPDPELRRDVQLLILGSPTHGGVATPTMQQFIKGLPDGSLRGIACATFDTRVGMRWVKFIGFAAPRMAHELSKLGGSVVAGPEGFYVKGKTGPLLEGETAHARSWANALKQQLHSNVPARS